jgi:hypothetical protein
MSFRANFLGGHQHDVLKTDKIQTSSAYARLHLVRTSPNEGKQLPAPGDVLA